MRIVVGKISSFVKSNDLPKLVTFIKIKWQMAPS